MIAYFILVHRYPKQFKRLFKSIYDPKNHYLIHIDKRAGSELLTEIRDFLASFPNAQILKSQNVIWGGYSMVDAELRGMKQLLKTSINWDFFINLSGQDFPLQSQAAITSFLRENMGKSFLSVEDQVKVRPNTLNRIKNYFVESDGDFTGSPIKRSFMPGVTPYIGGQWKILSRVCCEFITSSRKVAKFKQYYKNTLIPDESFFQTVLMNTDYKGTIVNDDKRAIIWIPDANINLNSKTLTKSDTKSLIASGKIKLRPKTFTVKDMPFLLKSKSLFARKFDELVDSEIFDRLELKLSEQKYIKNSKKQKIQIGIGLVAAQKAFSAPLVS